MRFGREAWPWQSLWWWLAVVAVVVQLKHHYSIATAAELEWTLRPLSQLLEWFTGHEFHRDDGHEWVSETADVRLVKGCAGINFMLMSFMAYAWSARPERCEGAGLLRWIAGRLPFLCAAIFAAWATGLFANSLRIIVAMGVDADGWELDVIGIGAAELHRLIGMGIYVPVLSLQMMLGNRSRSRDAVVVPGLLYLLLMVMVPLLTGNALQHPALFARHLLSVAPMIAVTWGIALLWHRWPANKRGHREVLMRRQWPSSSDTGTAGQGPG